MSGIVILFLVTLALAAGQAIFFGHSAEEIEDDIITITQACDGSSGARYKFCEAVCPTDFYAISGSCSTEVDFPNDSGYQYNLSGVLPDLRGWSCFNGRLENDPNEFVIAEVVCARTGGYTTFTYQYCGDYRIEDGSASGGITEACDLTNLGDWLDCTDFYTEGGIQLCNGELGCNNACTGFDISFCQYCDTGSCSPGTILCQDGTCNPDCSRNGGPSGPNGNLVGDAGLKCFPTAPCDGVSDISIYQGMGFCGNGVLDPGNNEVCEADSDCAGSGTFGVVCPDGTTVSSGYVCAGCQCVPNPEPCRSRCPPGCTTNQDCGFGGSGQGHPVCIMGCCVDIGTP